MEMVDAATVRRRGTTRMRFLLALLMILASPVCTMAGETGQLGSLLKGYVDHKQRLEDIRTARAEGASYGSRQMIELKRDLLAAIKAVDEYRTQLLRGREEAATHEVPLALKYAYLAMFHVISLDLDHDLYRSNLALTLSEKYVDVWRSVDPSIPRLSVP
jgi:hypothetical protein